MAISLSPAIKAIDFEFDSPNEVIVEEEFQVKIQLETSEDYDVKIYIQDDTKEYCEIYDGIKWRSPFTYIKNSFPKEKTYLLLSHKVAKTEICVKLRKSSNQKDVSEICHEINVISSKTFDKDGEEKNLTFAGETEEPLTQDQPSLIINQNNEKIILNSPAEPRKEYVSNEQKIRIGILYSFSFFCLVIIIFLALKRL